MAAPWPLPDRMLSVAEAAHELGITPDAVRKRLERGQLAGQKVDGRWRVAWPQQSEPETDSVVRSVSPVRPDHDRPSADGQADSPQSGDDLRALVRSLQSEVAWLRQQLEEATIERRNIWRLLALGPEPYTATEKPPAPRRRWWQWFTWV